MADDFKSCFKQATDCTPSSYQRRLADPSSGLSELLQVPTRKIGEDRGAAKHSMDDRSNVLVERIMQEATSGLCRTALVFVSQVDRVRAFFDRLSAVRPNDDQLLLLRARFLLEEIPEPKEDQVLFFRLCDVDIEALL